MGTTYYFRKEGGEGGGPLAEKKSSTLGPGSVFCHPLVMRSAFMNRIVDEVPNPDMLIFTDEAARNRRASEWTKGWALVGRRCVQRRHFIRGQRYSILPILTLDGIIAYDIIPGSVNSERFMEFLRELVVRFFLHLLGLKCV